MEKNLTKLLIIAFLIGLAVVSRFTVEFIYKLIWEYYALSSLLGFSLRFLAIAMFVLIWLGITLRSEYPHTKLPWLMLLALEPIIGLTLFLSFGRSFKQSKRFKNRPLMQHGQTIKHEAKPDTLDDELSSFSPDIQDLFKISHKQAHHQPFINQTHITILQNGEQFYPDLLASIERATSFILFEFFIVRDDETSLKIIDALLKKAESGVDVKVIFDGLGSARTSFRLKQKLKKSAIDFIINDPIYFPLFNTRINYRNHRKIVVIDGIIGYTGGMNIANEYDNNYNKDFVFRDTQIKCEGQAVQSLTALFFKDYYYNTNQLIDDIKYYPQTKINAPGVVQILESGPDSLQATIRDIYVHMIMNAKKSIKIMTPYMAIDQETLTALKFAAKSGVDIQIIVPGIPDKFLVYKVTKFYITHLIQEGIHFYTYNGGFSHAKIVIIDDKIASVGSYNLDNRSAIIDFEVTALFFHDAVETLLEQFELDKADSTQVIKENWLKRSFLMRLIEGVMSIFTPII